MKQLFISAMAAGALASGCATSELDQEISSERADSAAQNGTAFVHLFEWKWLDIAKECEEFLGPKGFEAVQISPPNEHIDTPEWWARYQPVSYKLESRSGTRQEFIEMVERCDAAGVAIYADLVINHTAAMSRRGWAGSDWSPRRHPDMGFGAQDYHSPCNITNYNDAGNVQYCSLVGLPDLDTGKAYVQDRIAAYIRELSDLGVAGFRVDAAKHMAPNELQAILNKAGKPYAFLEVIGAYGEAVQPSQYAHMGQVTEFAYSREIGDRFLNGRIKDLRYIGDNKLSSGTAVVFTDNHDNQRGHGAGYQPVTYKDGAKYNIANAFMLAWPYGYPSIMSSYEFSNGDQGPPAGGGGCSQAGRVCEHRWTTIANMVQFRNVTNDQPVSNWWDNGGNRIAFSRGSKGFIAINNEGSAMSERLQTGLAAGTYCNIAAGDFANGVCTGPTVTVDASGFVQVATQAYTALAIHVGAKLGSPTPAPQPPAPPAPQPPAPQPPSDGGLSNGQVEFTCNNGQTYVGQSVYVIGSIPALGSWDPARAVKLDPASYPTWKGVINVGTGVQFAWKCLKRDEQNPSAGVQWQGGSDNQATTPAQGGLKVSAGF